MLVRYIHRKIGGGADVDSTQHEKAQEGINKFVYAQNHRCHANKGEDRQSIWASKISDARKGRVHDGRLEEEMRVCHPCERLPRLFHLARMARRTKTAKAAPAAETSKDGITIHEIPLATPDFSKPTGPTLLDVIEEKRPRHTDGTPIGVDDGLDLEIPPVIIAFSFAVPLTMMLFAFDVLVHRQYRQELEYWLIFLRCSKAFPGYSSLTTRQRCA